MSRVDQTYPRDMIGYGRRRPQDPWLPGTQIAVQFVVNYEEGGESNVLHGDAASEAVLSEIVGAQPWPGRRHANMESLYEYGSRVGFWRLWHMFTAREMPVTVYGVATALERNPEAVAAMIEAGWDIATHGLKWIDYGAHPEEMERADIDRAVALHARVTGARPLGFYQGRSSVNTLKLGAQEGGFLYLSDAYADDLPYWQELAGRQQLIVPYTLDANDMRFATPQGFNSGEQFLTYLKDSFDVLYREGAVGRAGMLSIGLHCRLVGRPGRAAALERFLDYVRGHAGAWVTTRLDLARHWLHRHAPAGGYVPSRMGRALFVEIFGDVFEHTPAVAERAHARGIGVAQDDVDGLHAALVAVLRSLSADEETALLRAHPDLAGRLAQAGGMTAASTAEQASAGLHRLSAEEAARLTGLNAAYKSKFGFPFIVAVRGRAKADILDAVQGRLANGAVAERRDALEQVARIARLRLEALPLARP